MTKTATASATLTPDAAALSATVREARLHRDALRAQVARLERPTTDGGDPAGRYEQLAELPALKRDLYRAEAATERAEAALKEHRAAMRATVLAERRAPRRLLIKQLDTDLAAAAETLAKIVVHDDETARQADGATVDAIGWTADLLGVDAKLLAWRKFQREHGWL